MKLILRIYLLIFIGTLAVLNANGQSNGYINILTQNGGLVNVGSNVFIEVTVGNSGPVDNIPAGKLRVQLSVPGNICSILPTGHVLPTGWTILSNSGTSIQICNSGDVIPLFEERPILINVQGTNVGGPSTIIGQLDFRSNCSTPGTLNGDDASDNSSTTTIQVAPSCPLRVTASAGNIQCNGGTTTLTATVTNASGPTEYSLNSGAFQASNTFTVTAGTYSVKAREVNTPTCVTAPYEVNITQPPAVATPVVGTITQPGCLVSTGSVALSGLPSGNWTINPGAISGNTTSTTINDLATGIYNFTVTNAAGCSSSPSGNVVINTQPQTPATPVIGTITQPSCVVSTGSVSLSGLPAGNWIIDPGAFSGNTSTATINVNPGIYNFTVTNSSGCTSAPSAEVVINEVAGAPLAPVVNIVQPTCTTATGIITVTSATTGLTFSFDEGPFTTYPDDGYTVTSGLHKLLAKDINGCLSPVTNITVNPRPATPTSPVVDIIQPTCTIPEGTISVISDTANLKFSLNGSAYLPYPTDGYQVATGLYKLTVKNSSGCISDTNNITVNAQGVPPTLTVSASPIACNGEATTLAALGTGGTGALEYSLNNGDFQPNNVFTVSAGIDTIIVRDANLCTGRAIITVTQPDSITASVSTTVISCHGEKSALTVSVTGGVAPWQYRLNGGTYQTSNLFNVKAGTYTITVKDANNCIATTNTITIAQPDTFVVRVIAKRIARCGGTSEITVTATGGKAPYTGTGTFTRGPGVWNFSVTDAAGCMDSTKVTIDPPGCMDLRVYPNPATNSITINHSIAEAGSVMKIFEINGALILSKQVPQNEFLTTIDVTRLAAGSYMLVFWNGNDTKATIFQKIEH